MTRGSGHGMQVRHSVFPEMSPTAANAVFDELTVVVGESMTPGVDPASSWAVHEWTERRDEVLAGWNVYVAAVDGEVEGFITYQLIDLDGRLGVLIGVGCVRPAYQSQGLAYELNFRLLMRALVRSRGRGCFIVARMLNPAALHGWRKQVHDRTRCYPYLGSGPHPGRTVERAAARFVEEHEATSVFDPTTGVLKARHPAGPRATRPSGSAEVDAYFRDHVDVDAGDTVLMVIDINRRGLLSQLGTIGNAARRVLRRADHDRPVGAPR